MYVCMYVCMYGWMDEWVHVCIPAWIHLCIYIEYSRGHDIYVKEI